jgi:nitroreductase
MVFKIATDIRRDKLEVKEAIMTRYSCRAFKPDPVPEALIQDILATASRSPSYSNSQPWEVAVATGKTLAELNKRRDDLINQNVTANPDMPAQPTWPAPHQERTRAIAAQRQEFTNQAKVDAVSRYEATTQSSPVFGAPAVIFLFMDKTLLDWSIYDMGLFSQSLVLAAHERGLGTCIQAGIVRYPGEVRKILGIPDTKKLVVGISIGYPLKESRMNAMRTPRTDIKELTKWYK